MDPPPLRGVAAPPQPPVSAAGTPPLQRLCYLIQGTGRLGGQVQLSVWVESRDGACAYSPRAASATTDYPRYVEPQDRAILEALNARRPEGDIVGAAGFDVLRLAIATGRSRWQSLQAPTLRAGGTRCLAFLWQTLPDGSQRLQCESGPVEILAALEPALYIDTTSQECGPIECAYSDLVREFWAGRDIRPEEIRSVMQRIERTPGGGKFPRPRELEVNRQALQSLRAQLILKAGADAAVCFVYNGFAVDSQTLSAAELAVRHFDGDRLYEIDRDLDAERRLLAHLDARLPKDPEAGEAWLGFMHDELPRLRETGWEIRIDPSFPYRIAAAREWYADLRCADRAEWFDLRFGVVVDGKPVNLLPALVQYLQAAEARADMPAADGLTALGMPAGYLVAGEHLFVRQEDGGHLPVALTRVRRIADTLVEMFDRNPAEQALTLPRVQAGRLAQLAFETAPAWRSNDPKLLELIENLGGSATPAPLDAPSSFLATLRPYQQEGLGWLQFLRRRGLGGILADDMGLGKTVQTLAHLVMEQEQGRSARPSLIVAPVSVIGNWRKEIERFAPHLRLLTLHGSKRRESLDGIDAADIVITSYPLLHLDAQILQAHEFYYLILDEAQTLKNPRTKTRQAAQALRAEHRLCLTGTPLENHLGDLWSLFDLAQPGFLGEERQFQSQYRTPIEQGDERRAEALKERLRPVMLRRTKDAVTPDLPPKMRIVESIALDEPQRDFYDGIRLSMHRRVREVIESQGLARSRITVLDALLKLRQACCDPRLLGTEGLDPAIGSAKMQWLSASLPELLAQGRRVLLFSQFTSMLRLIESLVRDLDIPYCLLTGRSRDRAALVDEFQTGNVPLFLISLKAGGTGLNLTAADTVIHYDPWWNPAAESQATDRAHRIGQDKPVFVYKLITQGTIEEKILQLQAGKQALLGQLFGESKDSSRLDAADVRALFEP